MKRLALIGVVLLAGCGGGKQALPPRQPHLPRALAAQWRAQADAVAAALAVRDGCTAQARAIALRSSVIDAINARLVAPRFQEPLLAAVQDLPQRIGCTPPPPPVVEHGPPPGHGHHHGHEKHDRG